MASIPTVRKRVGAAFSGIAVVVVCASCATKAPPPVDEVRKDALAGVDLNHPWKSTTQSAESVQDNWLNTFQDPELDALVKEAIAHNPDLRVAAARVEQAREYLAMAQSYLKPSLAIAGTGGLKAGGGGSDISSALSGIVLAASWELDLWGRLRYARNAAQETYASSQADFEFARQSLAANTAKAWFAATQLSIQSTISGEMIRAAEQLTSLAQDRERVGAGTDAETAVARATVRNYEDAQQQILQAREQALRALELLIGRYPAAEIKIRTELNPLPGPVPAGLPLQMLDRRPDVVAAERRVAAAFHRVGEAKAAFFPKITLNASFGALSSEVLQLKEDFENPTAGLGARLFAPLYQGGALKAQEGIRNAEQREAVANYGRIALRALGDVENALAANASMAARVGFLNEALTEHSRAFDLTQKNFQVGRVDRRSIEQQQINVSNARIALVNARTEQLAQRVNLHLALGGSFDIPERHADARP